MIRWDEYIFDKKDYDKYDIEITKTISNCAGDCPIGKGMCDSAACTGCLDILYFLHNAGLEGEFEIGNAVNGAEDELEKEEEEVELKY